MEKVQVVVDPLSDGTIPSEGELLEAGKASGWSEDPGTGKAILVPDVRGAPAYEVINPLPIAPPIGWEPTPPIEELIRSRVAQEFARLRDEEEIDDIIDAEDFEVPDEEPNLETIYEFMGMEEQVPPVKPMSDDERAKAAVEYEGILEKHRRLAKIRSREEYERRRQEVDRLYGDPPPPREEKPED